mmetsp:Transcript_12665/g.28940  ORF Transcript_12665/g.28940 Transcript_12665/m.28940 type:complete len:206 (-) Transcript_12665:168-785(-)
MLFSLLYNRDGFSVVGSVMIWRNVAMSEIMKKKFVALTGKVSWNILVFSLLHCSKSQNGISVDMAMAMCFLKPPSATGGYRAESNLRSTRRAVRMAYRVIIAAAIRRTLNAVNAVLDESESSATIGGSIVPVPMLVPSNSGLLQIKTPTLLILIFTWYSDVVQSIALDINYYSRPLLPRMPCLACLHSVMLLLRAWGGGSFRRSF